ncbi:unnamed protein product [Darwinula stevensoni]|uniref:Phosphate transporter n=1 Tax=Darwinula stevensoni TaxID=69355 RepID=A0A7R9A0Z1_9CRUS|nr:unnamed protein product [Darwinula stevensoni]CAG0885525.1 unnamed protein product [Darwinula stevensoni]
MKRIPRDAGSKVAETMRSEIIDMSVYNGTEKQVMLGALATLGKPRSVFASEVTMVPGNVRWAGGSGLWQLASTYFGLPISTTHGVVGAIVGFTLVAKGSLGVRWIGIARIGKPFAEQTRWFGHNNMMRMSLPNPNQLLQRMGENFGAMATSFQKGISGLFGNGNNNQVSARIEEEKDVRYSSRDDGRRQRNDRSREDRNEWQQQGQMTQAQSTENQAQKTREQSNRYDPNRSNSDTNAHANREKNEGAEPRDGMGTPRLSLEELQRWFQANTRNWGQMWNQQRNRWNQQDWWYDGSETENRNERNTARGQGRRQNGRKGNRDNYDWYEYDYGEATGSRNERRNGDSWFYGTDSEGRTTRGMGSRSAQITDSNLAKTILELLQGMAKAIGQQFPKWIS